MNLRERDVLNVRPYVGCVYALAWMALVDWTTKVPQNSIEVNFDQVEKRPRYR